MIAVNRFLICRHISNLKKTRLFTRSLGQTSTAQEIIIDYDKRLPAAKEKKPNREPFAKNLFVGQFDTEFLTYFEPQTPERYKEFLEWLKPIQEHMKSIDLAEIENTREIPEETLQLFKEHGVFGARIDVDYKGFNLLNSEFMQLIETVSFAPGIAQFLLKQSTVPVDILHKYGTIEQKLKFLPDIASGRLFVSYGFTEPNSGPTTKLLESKASISKCESYWTLNGTKIFVANAKSSDTFLITAHALKSGSLDLRTETISTFIVDKNMEGVTVREPTKLMGLPGFHCCTVNFKDVQIPAENMIGNIGDGIKHSVEEFSRNKHFVAAQTIGILKRLNQELCKHVLKRKQFTKSLYEYESVELVVSNIACSIYGIEAALYMTTGMQDIYQDQDIQLESGIVETYSVTECLNAVNAAMNIFGAPSCVESERFKQFLLDAHTLLNYETSLIDTQIYTGLLGLEFYGREHADTVRKLRNPLMNKELFKRLMIRDPHKLNLYLREYLHPSLYECSEFLDKALYFLKKSAETLLIRYGNDITERHQELQKMSKFITTIYAYVAMISRSSRSYCIGNRDSDNEIKLCLLMAYHLKQVTENLADDIECSEYGNGDHFRQGIAQLHYQKKDYFSEHPLKRNYD